MRVLVAGGTGVLGRAAVPALRSAGHEVTTMSRRAQGLTGVEHLTADALDLAATTRAVAQAAPEVVVHALSALPPEGPRKARDLEATNRLRTTGTDNLLAACREAGVGRVVGESFMLAAAPASSSAAVDALQHLERGVTAAGGIVLRFGGFYGLGTQTTEGQIAALRKRRLPLPGGAPSVLSFVYIDDAASAVVVAVERGEAGATYEVADDEPVVLGDFLTEMARVVGAPPPRRIPLWPVKLLAPMAASFTAGLRLPLDNARLRALGWAPAYPTYREGLPTLVASGSGS